MSINTTDLISFVVPTLNEEKNIAGTIRAIATAMDGKPYEIIVVDNGSTDMTVEIARDLNVTVLVNTKASIGQLRNLGVEQSKGPIIAFLDADVQIGPDWHQVLAAEIESWPEDELIITGSNYRAPELESFLNRNWFSRLTDADTKYINSGHLVTTRTMHEKVGGFDAALRTAEDYDYCIRSREKGGLLKKSTKLKAFHYGFPESISQFISREAWHGRQDLSSISSFLASKSAIISFVNSGLILIGLLALLTEQYYLFLGCLIGTFLISGLSTLKKFGPSNPSRFLGTMLCFEIYMVGRTLSLVYKRHRPAARS